MAVEAAKAVMQKIFSRERDDVLYIATAVVTRSGDEKIELISIKKRKSKMEDPHEGYAKDLHRGAIENTENQIYY